MRKPTIYNVLGRAYGVYLYDENTVTHCCEFTPSYWLIQIQNTFERGFDDDAPELRAIGLQSMTDVEWVGDVLDDCYMHCHSVDQIPAERKQQLDPVTVEEGEDVDEYMDAIRDHLNGNPPFFPALYPVAAA